jgi:putative transposase
MRQDAASTLDSASMNTNDLADSIGYFDPAQPVTDLMGNLPHWRQEGVTYFVTFRLADSIPQGKLKQWLCEREKWLKCHPEPLDPPLRQEYFRLFVERFHKWLDAGYGKCVFSRPDLRRMISDALLFFENTRYLLREWIVMPNHVHAIVTPLADHEISKILHSWKSFTSKKVNNRLGRAGTFWQKESFDHIIRSAEQLERIEWYIHDNPRGLKSNYYTLHCLHTQEK